MLPKLRSAAVKSLRLVLATQRQIHTSPPHLETVKEELFSQKLVQPAGEKITIVGAGKVGVACAVACVAQNISNEICLFNRTEAKAKAEKWDLEQGACFLNSPKIAASKDYAATAGSRICIITAGVEVQRGESRLAHAQRNADILKCLLPELLEHSPDAILLQVANPVDVMTYAAWRVSGLPTHRVLGSGTTLDTARFHTFIAQRLGVSPSSVRGWVVGEHGDSSVPVWSGVSVGNVRLRDMQADIGVAEDPGKWTEVHAQVVRAGYEVQKVKGYTSWAIALSCAAIVEAILANTGKIMAVTTLAQHQQRIGDEIFLSLPCVLNGGGIAAVVQLKLDDHEKTQLHKSARVLGLAQEQIKF